MSEQNAAINPPPPEQDSRSEIDAGTLSQWQLIRMRFRKHRLAVVSLRVLVVLYTCALFAEFFAPYSKSWHSLDHMYSPPQLPRLSLKHGLHTWAVELHTDPVTFRRTYIINRENPIALGFFVRGERYKLLGLVTWDRHFFGIRNFDRTGENSPVTFFLLGGDKYGHDLFSRILFGARISLSVGLIGIAISFVLGLTIGGISGYAGGTVDNLIQRGIEIINAFPKLPLWLAFAAIMPADWSPLRVYFGITIVLSLMGWTGLARVVRGKILSLREEDYAVAARLLGASHFRIIFRHLLPGFTSHVIVSLTLTVPGMILGETSLSFLGLGLRPPVVSWGVLLQDCMNMQVVSNYPWLLLPVVFIVMTVLCFNFLGDGLRDAADPYH
ncbi:MAG: ABC transporter permease [Planctomycetota bacterium]|jgi:peptide/nickel transport system permease protein|nr:ABC transporter permease [Planctomycetota bacterium]